MTPTTDKALLHYFYHWEIERADKEFLKQPMGTGFIDFTFAGAGQQARKVAAYLRSLKLSPGTNIGLVSKNCAEWIITDLAIQMAGHISVPFYPTLTGEQLNQVLTHSGCKVLFVGKLDDWPGMKTGIPPAVRCISFPNYNPDPSHEQWNAILDKYEPIADSPVPRLTDLFTIIYTSGTTGNPKGVMATHGGLSQGIYNTRKATLVELPDTRFFSYLPLCHVAERMIVECAAIISGGTIFFAENLDTFAANLQRAKPTHFLAVPRIWAKFQEGILKKMNQRTLDILLKVPIVSGLLKKKIVAGLGLDKAELVLTGAAPMPVALHQWFLKLGIKIQEAYGMTENLGAVCMTPRDNPKSGTVGKIYPNVEIKFDEATGELLTRSPWNMVGYYNEPALTAEAMDADGWIHTGDVAELDADGFIVITGRSKEMYKTSKGEYVAPAQIEMQFAEYSFLEQVIVMGVGIPQPVALVALSESGKKIEKDLIMRSLEEGVARINQRLKPYERIHRVIILQDTFTVENNMLTPTMKLKRNVIEKHYASRLNEWFERQPVVSYE